MNQTILDAITNGHYTSKTLEAKFGKKKVKEMQKMFDNLIHETLIPKERSTSNIHYSLVTIKPPDQQNTTENSQEDVGWNNVETFASTSNPHPPPSQKSYIPHSSSVPSYKEVLFGIVENYKKEIIFLREQVKQKDILLNSQQKVINELAASNSCNVPKHNNPQNIAHVIQKQFRDDISVTSCSSDETDLEEMKMLYMQQEIQRRNSNQKTRKKKKKSGSGNKVKVKRRTVVDMIRHEPRNTFLRIMKRTGLQSTAGAG